MSVFRLLKFEMISFASGYTFIIPQLSVSLNTTFPSTNSSVDSLAI
jgi:hypothetical protein